MVFISPQKIVLSGPEGYCYEEVEMSQLELSNFLGNCSSSTNKTQFKKFTGHRLRDVRIFAARGVTFDGSRVVYVTLLTRLLAVDTSTDMVEVVAHCPAYATNSLAFDIASGDVVMTTGHALIRVDLNSGSCDVIAGSTEEGSSAGNIETSGFSSPMGLVKIGRSDWLFADRGNNRFDQPLQPCNL